MTLASSNGASPEVLEGLWEAETQYGPRLSASDQVALAREIVKTPVDRLTVGDIETAFGNLKLARPPRGYASTVLRRVRRMHKPRSLVDELIAFRQFAIRALSRQFGGKTKGREGEMRNALLTYLQRGYAEADTGRGNTDILLPPPEDAVIEAKVWTTRGVYEEGMEELARYIHTERPKQAAFVVFGDRDPLPPIVTEHTQAIAEVRELEGLEVPVVVVPFEVDPPSKARRNEKRRRDARG